MINDVSGTGLVHKYGTAIALAALMATSVLCERNLEAAAYVFNYSSIFSGSAPLSSERPWVQATFTDVASGRVELVIIAPRLTGAENVESLYFNLDPALNPTQLTFSRSGIGGFDDPAIDARMNAFRAGGDGKFDILSS